MHSLTHSYFHSCSHSHSIRSSTWHTRVVLQFFLPLYIFVQLTFLLSRAYLIFHAHSFSLSLSRHYMYLYLGARGSGRLATTFIFSYEIRFNVFPYFLQLRYLTQYAAGRAFTDVTHSHSFVPFSSSLSLSLDSI